MHWAGRYTPTTRYRRESRTASTRRERGAEEATPRMIAQDHDCGDCGDYGDCDGCGGDHGYNGE